jgi:hypothetical protein
MLLRVVTEHSAELAIKLCGRGVHREGSDADVDVVCGGGGIVVLMPLLDGRRQDGLGDGVLLKVTSPLLW